MTCHATNICGIKIITQTGVDVAKRVRAGRRLVAREETMAMLDLHKADMLSPEEVISAIEAMVNGAIADCRMYHRIPEPGAPELPMQPRPPMPLGAHEPPQMPKIVGDWPADET